MKKLIIVTLLTSSIALGLAGCGETQPSSDQMQQRQQEKLLQEGTRQTGMPTVTNFTERKEENTIISERDKANLITYLYTQNQMTGKWVYQGEAIGFPIPYSTEYTNPQKIQDSGQNYGYAILPQADPNGLFSSQNTQADWIMRIDPKTHEVKPAFVEHDVYVTETKIPAYLCESFSIPSGY